MDVHKWALYLVVSCVIVTTDGHCPLTCSSFDCYLIYSQNGKWKYKDADGTVYDAGNVVYQSPNCYKFIRAVNTNTSCYDAQRRCEDVGSNITAINNREEYDQLIQNVLQILSVRSTSTFIVHVLQNLIDLSVEKGCAKINVYDSIFNNIVEIENIDCSSRSETNTVICESTDLNTEICPVAATEFYPPSTYATSTLLSFSMPTSTSTRWSQTQTISSQTSEKYSKEPRLISTQVPVTASVVTVIVIIIIILSFVLIRRGIKRRNVSKGSQNRDADTYDDASSVEFKTHIQRHHQEINELYQHSQNVPHQISNNVGYVNTDAAPNHLYCEIQNKPM